MRISGAGNVCQRAKQIKDAAQRTMNSSKPVIPRPANPNTAPVNGTRWTAGVVLHIHGGSFKEPFRACRGLETTFKADAGQEAQQVLRCASVCVSEHVNLITIISSTISPFCIGRIEMLLPERFTHQAGRLRGSQKNATLQHFQCPSWPMSVLQCHAVQNTRSPPDSLFPFPIYLSTLNIPVRTTVINQYLCPAVCSLVLHGYRQHSCSWFGPKHQFGPFH
ncbi:unnamed protein product [Leuciscus chuanchicus]